ncbi:MAG: T9SS type A sorting domain-containing protein [Candidatus Marinimicrobia bacterium]|nr:T9SS type A sorting domain-containing protein [Candidatus Neomarinimicrobiota bacterium]MCF7850463.1 T9SS type A sorting domain-containing protein [Candidatus Neomarinimicrobiota bacterium]MCF7905186.1 T9SS type A sorting domain-containing protein [Candidatus Neomarinimicrobiota bacterium]
MAKRYGQLAKLIPTAGQTDYDVKYYDLDFRLDIAKQVVYGKTEIHLESTIQDLRTVRVDLAANLFVESVYHNAASFSRSGDVLIMQLDRAYVPGKPIKIGISYRGTPAGGGFQGFLFSTQDGSSTGIPIVSTLSEPYGARTWWPCKDVPTDKADSVRISITADGTLTAVANGLLESVTDNDNGSKTWVWKHSYPITTYLVSIIVTEYSYWNEMYHFADGDSMLLEYWMYPSKLNTSSQNRWNRTEGMLDIFNEAYGKYPFHEEKYGMAEFGWVGAMEHQTCSSMGNSGENTIAHELAHQWWGDLVTCTNFHHIWINEGFATYSEALYWGEKYGEPAYHSHMASKDMTYTGSIYRNDTTSVNSIFNYIVYGKGSWALHMLRHITGDEAFFQILADYREAYKYSHASTEDFQSVAESVYGESLEWFFDPWIYGTGRPHYLWSWHVKNPEATESWEIRVDLKQTQYKTASSFDMPIDFYFWNDQRDTTVVLFNSKNTEYFTFDLDFKPANAELDPEGWILKHVTQTLHIDDTMASPEEFVLLDAYPNPFNPKVTIPYSIFAATEGQLEIYDMSGHLVYSHPIVHQHAGNHSHEWNAADEMGNNLSSGIYLVRIWTTQGVSRTQKISLLK